MKRFLGVKQINAKPMNRLEYNNFKGWELPSDENGEDEGYLVEYIDGGQPNTKEFKGYVSWSPKEVFEKGYRNVEGLTFGFAIEAMKKGHKVARKGWNGKGMFLKYVDPWEYSIKTPIVYSKIMALDPWIGMKTAGDTFVPWLASQSDVLSEDWVIIE